MLEASPQPDSVSTPQTAAHLAQKAQGRGLERVLRILLGLAIAVGATLTYETVYGLEGLPKRATLAADLARVQSEHSDLSARLSGLQRDIVAQKDRQEVQETLVRNVLGYVRPGEIVLQPRR